MVVMITGGRYAFDDGVEKPHFQVWFKDRWSDLKVKIFRSYHKEPLFWHI